MPGFTRILLFACVLIAANANAQRAGDNAVRAADDAFGTSIGNESIGLYSTSQVRGFSPVTAGNVRIEGLYMDRQGWLSQRLVAGSSIRVGLSAQGYAFPAPTGIVDYRLRPAGSERIVSVVAGSLPYGAPSVEIDAQFPLLDDTLSVAAGLSWAHEEYYDGSDAPYLRAALIPRWRPRDNIEVIPFWSFTTGRDEQVAPTIIMANSVLPPSAPRRRYLGQDWAAKDSRSNNSGLIVKAEPASNWELVSGIFRSVSYSEENFAELFTGTTPDGVTNERVVADPFQRYEADSGEIRLTRNAVAGSRLHKLHAMLRGRRLDSTYGGSAPALDLGVRQLGNRMPVLQPTNFAFGEHTQDKVRQATFGFAYDGRWQDRGEMTLGIQHTDYDKTIDLPGDAPAATSADQPWLPYGTLALYMRPNLALYAGYTRGLEESGIAPNNVLNRNEALPAIRTQQIDGGLRWTINENHKLVLGAFDVRKPYFNTDEANRFVVLGEVRHRGIEFSLTSTPSARLNILFGAVVMEPRVTGQAVTDGRVGKRPLGQSAAILRLNADYRPAFLEGLSFDVALSGFDRRPASRDNRVMLPSYALVDLGARYRFMLGAKPATLRVQLQNVANEFVWNVVGSNSYGFTDRRRLTVLLTMDL